ncbi:UDP-2,4-diacetamido-2,4,6-trideoxy-beta-L-altropyranose hydrolase [Anaerovibrio lipolyticus]|uniref:UDP-2,4-diacetamido-2,4, 6-trideoxy-beta-L-altropyranose hydrolase n=1 Tax=Anaerovibrio lipolyticus TaxID=82374 RepID=UPI001F340D03|nr:UDP-2,4-diacetamido-2,4,6-trideoxy-beta-L-altropyranose hydrolase [Anaerovibrio lipolyticus]MCF2600466.1 UDP-2,4-diacetamido-2,4,6-trideoxy-beta-L-altropyranose hydrolase [Anaerovibrio lipolyticus]
MGVIVFRADASRLIGSGHVMRCLTLAQRLRKEQNAKVIFIMRKLSGNLIDVARKQGFTVLVLPQADEDYKLEDYGLWLTVPMEVDAQQTIKVLQHYLQEHDCDVADRLIVDSYALDEQWERMLRPYCKEIMVIDDLANRRHECDILLDQNFYSNKDVRYAGLVPEHCKMLLGPEHALLREEFYESKKHLRKRDGNIKNILVFYGGSDLTNETEKAIKALVQLHDEGYSFTADIITGLSNYRRGKIEKICSKYHFLHYYCQVSNMAEFMNKADLMLGAGGSTTWERLYMELPALVTAVAENQIQGCEDCRQAGIIEYLGINKDVRVDTILEALHKKLDKHN